MDIIFTFLKTAAAAAELKLSLKTTNTIIVLKENHKATSLKHYHNSLALYFKLYNEASPRYKKLYNTIYYLVLVLYSNILNEA